MKPATRCSGSSLVRTTCSVPLRVVCKIDPLKCPSSEPPRKGCWVLGEVECLVPWQHAAVVNPTLSAGVVVVPLSAPGRVWCTRRTGSNTVLKLRRNMWEVLQGGKERKGYSSLDSRRSSILPHKLIYMHCPQTAAAPGAAAGPSPGADTTMVGPCRAWVVAHRCQRSNIWFPSLFPALVSQHLPPWGVANGCGWHTAMTAFASAAWQSELVFYFKCSSLCSNTSAHHNVQ